MPYLISYFQALVNLLAAFLLRKKSPIFTLQSFSLKEKKLSNYGGRQNGNPET